jgi:hypothetical protein
MLLKGSSAGSDGFGIAGVEVPRVGTGVAGVETGIGSMSIDTETAVILA